MDWTSALLLAGAGLGGGFLAGLVGVGGGVIFSPVLFFYYQHAGLDPALVTPLTLGTSLLCTLLTATSGAWFHARAGNVNGRVALLTGLFSGGVVLLMTRFVTTQPWYDATVFKVVFGAVLLAVIARMVWPAAAPAALPGERRLGWPWLALTGSSAGAVAAAAGVGGGIVVVPAYAHLLRLPMARAVGTSSATIVLIATFGVLNYGAAGWGAPTPGFTLGFVDVPHALVLALPAMVSARLGVWASARLSTRWLRLSFAALATFVALRLLLSVLW